MICTPPILGARYHVKRPIGQGGMATVYLAHDVKHDRDVAIKVMGRGFSRAVGVSRFLREISVTAQLDHPHLLTLFDSGEAEGELYYIMPYVEGPSLRNKLSTQGRFAVEEAIDITRQVASALDYAHQQGVVHRDIKPENILFRGEHAILTDFGIAFSIESADGERLTEAGLCLGTPAYMSPEQIRTERTLDRRSDIYSLACVLYEMLTGAPPFKGRTPKAVAASHLYDRPPPLWDKRPDTAKSLQVSMERALAKVAADRFESVAAFADALQKSVRPSRWSAFRAALSIACFASSPERAEEIKRDTENFRTGFGTRLGGMCQAILGGMHGVLSLPHIEGVSSGSSLQPHHLHQSQSVGRGRKPGPQSIVE